MTSCLLPHTPFAALNTIELKKVATPMGPVAVYHKPHPSNQPPLLFLHGLFFDHQLWSAQITAINNRNVYAIDMPLHGNSIEDIKKHWNMEDIKKMVVHLLDGLAIGKVHAVGHSWGSMALLEAALEHPERFASLTMFNLPFTSYTPREKWAIRVQHIGLLFKNTYIKVASRKLFAPSSLQADTGLYTYLGQCMKKMSNRSITRLDKRVRLHARDRSGAFKNLQVPFVVVVAKEDGITKKPPTDKIVEVSGGHTTPLERKETTLEIITSIIN